MFNFFKSGFQKVKNALSKTSSLLGSRLKSLFSKPYSEETIDSLEQIFYEADLGTSLSIELSQEVKKFLQKHPRSSYPEIIAHLNQYALSLLAHAPEEIPLRHPHVILVVGVNGSGKTTSIAKLAQKYQQEGKKVLLIAGDTFRAAATEQLTMWAERCGVDIVKGKIGSDPSAVVFDGLTKAKNKEFDIVLIDTAGRLQNKTDLMHELEKIKRTAGKLIPSAPHETLLILDATTGQNALDQARIFHQFTPLTGLVLTKLDGSAKGGIVLSIFKEMKIPILYIGVGEQADDLLPFDPKAYVDALFSEQ